MRATTDQPASLSLLDGDLLEDLDGIDPTFDAWLTTERERLRDRARNVAEALLREQVEPEAAIPAAQRLLPIDRAHEGAWRALMRAHAARGERGMAIQAYDRCRAVLADLLDAAPSPETQKLLAEIRGPSAAGCRCARRPRRPRPTPAGRRAEDEPDEPPAVLEPQRRRSAPARGGAHVGVLPLQLVGTSDEEAHLGTGLAEEITTALARFRWMFVVVVQLAGPLRRRNARRDRDPAHLRHRLPAGRHRSSECANRLRITLRLLDLRAGNQVVWARRFDRQTHDLLTLQDEIAAEVVAQIDPEILLIEAQRSASRPPTDATAYDLVLRAIPLIGRLERGRSCRPASICARRSSWSRTTPRPMPGTPTGTCSWSARAGRTTRARRWTAPAQLAERAIVLDPFDARALTIAGHVRAFLHHRLREAVVAARAGAVAQPEPGDGLGAVRRRLRLSRRRRKRPSGATTATRSCRRWTRTRSSSTRSSSSSTC